MSRLEAAPRSTTRGVARSPWLWLSLWLGLWLASRLWMLSDWMEHWDHIANDVRYYFWSLTVPGLGDQRLVEYPVPVVWFLDALRLLGPDQNSYLIIFGVAMAALDLTFLVLLWRTGRMAAVAFWIMFVHGYGSLIWFRYDMVPALAVGLAALWVTRHPARSGAMVALGAALKLWPALLIAPLLGRHRPGRARLFGFGVVGFTLALLAFAGGGWKRLLSPLTWQGDRGLQIEAIPATWLMWQHAFNPSPSWQVKFSAFNAFEIFGPGVEGWLRVADLAMGLTIVMAVAMAVVVWRRGALPADVLTLCLVAVVAGMLVGNKTFSPQYLIWLGAPMAALLVESVRRLRWKAAVLAVLSLAMAVLTQQVYPVRYGGLIQNPHNDHDDTMVLVARNLMLVVFWLLSTVWAWQLLLRRPSRRSTSGRADTAEVVNAHS